MTVGHGQQIAVLVQRQVTRQIELPRPAAAFAESLEQLAQVVGGCADPAGDFGRAGEDPCAKLGWQLAILATFVAFINAERDRLRTLAKKANMQADK